MVLEGVQLIDMEGSVTFGKPILTELPGHTFFSGNEVDEYPKTNTGLIIVSVLLQEFGSLMMSLTL